MSEPRSGRERIWSLAHIVIGGVLCFFVMFVLSALAQTGIETLLGSMGSLGVLVIDQAINGMYIIMFGLVYLPSGFCGGLYTGWRTEENLKIALGFTGIVGFTVLLILSFGLGSLNPASLDVIASVLIPLVGVTVGAYLGGYTITWETEEEFEEEEPLDFEPVVKPPRRKARSKND